MAGLLPNLAGLFAQRGVQAIAAGLLSGVVGGSALVISGIVPVGGRLAADTVALTTCPGFGPVLATVPAGQTLLVTARSADGSSLQIYVGQPGIDRAWAPAADLRLESAADALPVEDCSAAATTEPSIGTPAPTTVAPSPTIEATVVPTATPAATPTAGPTPAPNPTATPRVTPKPTPRPTPKPTPKPPPTPPPPPTPTPPPPDTTPPNLSNLVITSPGPSNDGTYNIYGAGCPDPHSATIQVRATDASSIAKVTLFYWPGNSPVLNTGMSFIGNNTWQATITAQGSWGAGHEQQQGLISYWVRAEDVHGNVSPVLNGSNQYTLYKDICIL